MVHLQKKKSKVGAYADIRY